MIISNVPVPNTFKDNAGNILKMATFQLGHWNMQTHQNTLVDIGDILVSQVLTCSAVFYMNLGAGYCFGGGLQDGATMLQVMYSESPAPGNGIKIELSALTTTAYWSGDDEDRGRLHLWYTL